MRGTSCFFGMYGAPSVTLLCILSVVASNACRRKEDRRPSAHDVSVRMEAVIARGGRWLAVGTRGAGHSAQVTLMSGTPAGHRKSMLVKGRGYYGRDVSLGARTLVVGERAVSDTQAVLGHPQYDAYLRVVDDQGRVQSESTSGARGATGWKRVLAFAERTVLLGAENNRGWVRTQTSTSVGWVHRWADVNRVHDGEIGLHDEEEVLGLLGEAGPITRGQPRFRVVDKDGRTKWSWSGPDSAQLTALIRTPDRSWLLGGHTDGRGLIVALDSVGKVRWQWSAQAAELSSSSRVSALSVNASGRILVVLAHPFAAGEAARPTLLLLAADGRFSSKPVRLGAKSQKQSVQIFDAEPLSDGWLLAGAQARRAGLYEGYVWRLRADGDVLWASAWGVE